MLPLGSGVSCQAQVSSQVGALKRFRASASGSPFVPVDVPDNEREELISKLQGMLKEAALPPTSLPCSVDLALRGAGLFGLGVAPEEDQALGALEFLDVPFSRALVESGVAKKVNALRRRTTSEEVRRQAKVLLLGWRNGYRSILRKARTVAMDIEHVAHSISGAARGKYHRLASELLRELQPHRATATALIEDRLTNIVAFVGHLDSAAEHEQRAWLTHDRARARMAE